MRIKRAIFKKRRQKDPSSQIQKPDLGSEKKSFHPFHTLYGKLGLSAWLHKPFLERHPELRIRCYGPAQSI